MDSNPYLQHYKTVINMALLSCGTFLLINEFLQLSNGTKTYHLPCFADTIQLLTVLKYTLFSNIYKYSQNNKSTNSNEIFTKRLLLFPVQDYKHSSVAEQKCPEEGTYLTQLLAATGMDSEQL